MGFDRFCEDENGVYDKGKLEDVIADFMVVECGIRKLAPDTVYKTYLPGIAAMMDTMKKACADDFRTAINSKEVKLVFRGFERQYNRKRPKAARHKLPFGLDLALRSKRVMADKEAFGGQGKHVGVLRKRVFVAMAVGILFLLRCSEHVESKNGTAVPLTRKLITFIDYNNRPIPYAMVGHTEAKRVVLNV